MRIYKITNLITGKCYIGKESSKTVFKRWHDHIYEARSGFTTYLAKAIRKYSEDAFDCIIIEDGIKSKQVLNAREKYWIGFYNTFKGRGYNMTSGGDGGCEFDPIRTEKYVSTCNKKYGVSNISQLQSTKDKVKSTCISRLGYSNPFKSPSIIDSIKKANIKKYGHEHHMQNKDIYNKSRATYLERTGYDNPMHNPSVIKKKEEAYFEKTGYYNPAQNPYVQEKKRRNNKTNVPVWYNNNRYESIQLAYEQYCEDNPDNTHSIEWFKIEIYKCFKTKSELDSITVWEYDSMVFNTFKEAWDYIRINTPGISYISFKAKIYRTNIYNKIYNEEN